MTETIVEMRHITKRFPGIIANDDINLSIGKGEIFALLGENGAGKSTLMSMLFGLYEPDEGEFLVRGQPVRIDSPNQAVALDIGMVHQHFQLVSNFTVTENIIMGVETVKRRLGIFPAVDLKNSENKVAALSEQYGLEVDPRAVIDDLQISERQRVEILKMLYRNAEILIFDEPTAVLTPQEIQFLLQIIRNLRDNGKTVILITHKLDEIKQVADRCAILNRGRLIAVRDVRTTSTQEMARLMVGHDIAFTLAKKPAQFGEEILRVDKLTVENEEKYEALRQVSFSVHRGEIYALAGVAGNGQVELADAICGLLQAKSGRVYFRQTDITQESVRTRNLRGLSYIPEDRQSVGLILDFSLQDNLVMKRYYQPGFRKGLWINREHWQSYAKRLSQAYDIRSANGIQTIVRSMSGGNQQKVIIAREIDQDSDLQIYVQPTRGLDIGAITSIREKLIQERDHGKAILLISLELDEIMACADTIGVLYHGSLQTEAPAGQLDLETVGAYMMGAKHE
ncbi:MAG: ABC transporter ATP-binding protein [Oscillospiraceae bacterium]|nr:ABC transporter ATP-binding protein [Oscillospiraceae bacterium]MDD4368368.1 ABC transporter ATP-binding protein [Oscillospiraceae bacterium]